MIARLLIALSLIASAGAEAQSVRIEGNLPRKDGRPLEVTAGLETVYGSVRTSDGYRLRTIVTRPSGSRARLPALFVTQAVSCESLEFPPDVPTSLRQLALRSAYVLIRVERSGTGDSEGPACSELDYDTEVRHYREAFDRLAAHPWIDPGRIVIYGSSLGSTTAPLVAQGKKVAGLIVQGGGALTYLERMVHFDRLWFERSGKFRPQDVHVLMLRAIRFQQEYLIGRKTPEAIEREHPDLKGVWASLRGTVDAPPHYGRPHAWHWQAAEKNFLGAWAAIDAPVMVVYGEYEQFEPRHGHRMIVETVNALRPGTATFLEIPKADHSLRIHPSAIAAYRGEGGRTDRELFLAPVLAWLKAVAERQRAGVSLSSRPPVPSR